MVDPLLLSSSIQIIVVDDDEITRIGLKHALESMRCFSSIIEAESAEDLMVRLPGLSVDLVLLDIGMPGMDGIEATRLIKQSHSHIKVLIFTHHVSEDKISAALQAGADAYCVKNMSVEKLRLAIDCVLQGAVWLDPVIARKVLSSMAQPGEVPHSLQPDTRSPRSAKRLDLTEREFDVLRLITKGKSNKEIALSLSISPYTVKTHIRNLTQKLGVEDRTQAAIKALTEHLL